MIVLVQEEDWAIMGRNNVSIRRGHSAFINYASCSFKGMKFCCNVDRKMRGCGLAHHRFHQSHLWSEGFWSLCAAYPATARTDDLLSPFSSANRYPVMSADPPVS